MLVHMHWIAVHMMTLVLHKMLLLLLLFHCMVLILFSNNHSGILRDLILLLDDLLFEGSTPSV